MCCESIDCVPTVTVMLVGSLFLLKTMHSVLVSFSLTLYDPGGALKAPPPIFCSHAFNFGAALLYIGDFSQKIV